MISKKNLLLVCLIFITSVFVYSQPVRQNSDSKYYLMGTTPSLKINKYNISKINSVNVPNYLELNKSDRGLVFEKIGRTLTKKSLGVGYKEINVTYNNGRNGIDGVFYRKKDGHVIVQEIKSQNADLEVKGEIPQMTKPWIDKAFNKRINELKSTRNKRELKKLYKIKESIDSGNYSRMVTNVEMDYKNMDVVVRDFIIDGEKNWKGIPIKKRNPTNVFNYRDLDLDSTITTKISLLDKNHNKLSLREKKIKKEIFSTMEKHLKVKGYDSYDVDNYISTFKKGGQFSPELSKRVVLNSEDINTIYSKSVQKVKRKNYSITNKVTNGFLISLTIFNQYKTITSYLEGNIGKSDFIFNTTLNGLEISGFFVPKINCYMAVVHCCIDVIKNVYDFCSGKISFSDAVINVTSNICGVVAATVSASAISAAIGVAVTTGVITGSVASFIGTPVGGVVVGILVTAIAGGVYYITSSVIRYVGNFIKSLWDDYQSEKYFDRMCVILEEYYFGESA